MNPYKPPKIVETPKINWLLVWLSVFLPLNMLFFCVITKGFSKLEEPSIWVQFVSDLLLVIHFLGYLCLGALVAYFVYDF